MKTGDSIYTPRFTNVIITEMFDNEESARLAGYKEPTYYKDLEYGILGRSEGINRMTFAAYRKEGN